MLCILVTKDRFIPNSSLLHSAPRSNPDSTMPPNPNNGLAISNSDSIRSFLTSASSDPLLPQDLRQSAADLSSHSSVPYKALRSIWFASKPDARPELLRLFSGSDFIFTCPKPREKSEELKARLRKLEELAERKEYEELVKDITPRKGTDEPFSSYKDQLGFGLHVVVTMFTGYLFGYAAFRALFNHSPVMNAAGGILGFVCAMLLETLLFIIRASNQDLKTSSSTSKMKKNQ
ncbi:hypothetical protein RHMOL_Rhmol07G0152800 [Rhododendron molle]|uniref:Uncharacterized protein n=2 Tax=Rhododendron molle TaxID=49168 RepID=A0ACC0N2T2_RHOML|nr:hypothetical protein RHMOL_Rhmol07G0152800 [Rhododendron molle]KAI8546868.1 hypothetical protein RHMOL_Rhmol07G0152800 [Rhododendron molle]